MKRPVYTTDNPYIPEPIKYPEETPVYDFVMRDGQLECEEIDRVNYGKIADAARGTCDMEIIKELIKKQNIKAKDKLSFAIDNIKENQGITLDENMQARSFIEAQEEIKAKRAKAGEAMSKLPEDVQKYIIKNLENKTLTSEGLNKYLEENYKPKEEIK